MIDDSGPAPQFVQDRDEIGRLMCADAGEEWIELTEAGRERWRKEADAQTTLVNAALVMQFVDPIRSLEEFWRRVR
jgi:hypothetical protein